MDRKAQFSLWLKLSKSLQSLLESYNTQLEKYLANDKSTVNESSNWLSQTSLSWGSILSIAIDKTGDSSLALKFGQHLSPSTLGPLGYVLVSSKNISAALNVLVKYWSIISDEVNISLEQSLNYTSLLIEPNITDPIVRRSFIESILSGVMSIGQLVVRKGFSGFNLYLDYPQPHYYNEYNKLLKTKNEFSASRCELKIPNNLLIQKIDTSNPYVEPFLKYQCELVSSSFFSEFKLTRQICWILVESNNLNMPLSELTNLLHFSERTLRRKLKVEKTTYGEIRDKIKRALAEEYLKNSEFTIEDISLLLGYSEKSSFKRAFKRWNCISPYSFRVNSK